MTRALENQNQEAWRPMWPGTFMARSESFLSFDIGSFQTLEPSVLHNDRMNPNNIQQIEVWGWCVVSTSACHFAGIAME